MGLQAYTSTPNLLCAKMEPKNSCVLNSEESETLYQLGEKRKIM